MEILLSKNLVQNNHEMGVFIPSFQICPLAAEKGKFALPVDRPTVIFLTVEPTERLPDRPGLDPESNGSLAGRLPGRPKPDTESRLSVRSTARSTGGFSREQSSLPVDCPGRPGPFLDSRTLRTVDRPGQPAHQLKLACTLVHVGRPTTATVDRQSASPAIIGLKNLTF